MGAEDADTGAGALHLLSLRYVPPERAEGFPFSVPVVRSLDRLAFEAAVTILVGDNGSGKSTLLEGLAAACGLPAVGAEEVAEDRTLAPARRLAACLRLTWRRRAHRGFFLRAEDFFAFCRRLAAMRAEIQRDMAEMEERFADRSAYARGLALGPLRGSLAALDARYGEDLDAHSHGEAFLHLFRARLVPGGLYLLDEPEAALSPTRQLTLLALMREMVGARCQFVVATHSPILMAYPGAALLSCDQPPLRRVAYGDLESVRLMRDFLNAPERFLRHL